MEEESINIGFTAKKQDIVGKVVITTSEKDPSQRTPVSE
jgi:hypothetical protein